MIARFLSSLFVSAFAFVLTGSPAAAADKLDLTLVWTRVADINGEEGSVESAEFSPDSSRIVSGSKFDNMVIMWRTSDGAELWRQEVDEELERVGWSPDGKWVASCSEDFMLRLFNAENGEQVWEFPHTEGIDSLAWSNDGTMLVTGEEDAKVADDDTRVGKLRVFKMPERELVYTVDHGHCINQLDFSPADDCLVSAGDNSIMRIWRTSDMKLLRSYEDESAEGFVTARISPDGKMVAISGFDGHIHLVEFADCRLIRKFKVTGEKVESLAWSPDGKYLLCAGHGRDIRIYRRSDMLDSNYDQVLSAHVEDGFDSQEYINFNPSGSMLVSAHQDGMVRLWVFMSEDPDVNSRRHDWVRERQKRYHEKRPVVQQ